MSEIEEIRIKKVHTLLDLIIAAVVTAAGVGVYFVLPGWGILFCFIGILLFVFFKRSCRRVGDSLPLKARSLDIAPEAREGIINFLEQKAETLDFAESAEGDHLYLEAYYNAERQVAYARLYDVAENRFEPATEMVELHGPMAEKLIGKL
ncbi:MAG: hypothetical protein IJK32_04835 [Bacteroidales bacterium]|nr:hypothetical protein [Bacteroidales bacterium]